MEWLDSGREATAVFTASPGLRTMSLLYVDRRPLTSTFILYIQYMYVRPDSRERVITRRFRPNDRAYTEREYYLRSYVGLY